MQSPFENPKEVNPFASVKPIQLHIPPPKVIVVEKIITKDDRNRWL